MRYNPAYRQALLTAIANYGHAEANLALSENPKYSKTVVQDAWDKVEAAIEKFADYSEDYGYDRGWDDRGLESKV